MSSKRKYTITSALPYANGPLHIGHIAGAYLTADILVRYLRMKDDDVLFVCGSDEHGAAITLRAKKEGTTPKEIVDQYHSQIKKAFEDFGIAFDIYHRTSSELHHETASEFFKVLDSKNVFTRETVEQFYDEDHQQFLADRYVTGTCPNCSSDRAYGDQCEKCGATLNPLDLINPISTLSGKVPILKETTHWYLPLNDHESWLRTWIEDGKLDGMQQHNPKEWKNQVTGQCMSWIDGGLNPRAMTRDLDWGVKVPLPNAEGKVLYVWLDAPIGYISATKQWALDHNKDWKDYWQNPDRKLVHFIGKDNIVFHCIIFPALLKAHGDFILPYNVPANEFLNLEGDKLSTSRNWAVWLHEYLEDFPGKQDELRYVLCSILPESKDSEFTWKDYQARVNNELVAILGNFVNRAIVLTEKYYNGVVPALNEIGSAEEVVIAAIHQAPAKIGKQIEAYRFREALAEAMNLARAGNKYLTETEPWKLVKTDAKRTATILNLSLQITANLSWLLEPFLPTTAGKLRKFLRLNKLEWADAGSEFMLLEGSRVSAGELLFSKCEDEIIIAQIEKLKLKSAGSINLKIPPMKEEVSFEEFVTMDIRVGEILTAEKVEKADKLLKLSVDVGLDTRTIVSGIAEHFSPEDVVGKKVCVLVNLAPRKIRGVESQGMILMAENAEGKLALVAPQAGVDNGSVVR